MNNTALCWIDESIVPAAEASVSVFDHGLLYGDGVFEGLRFYQGKTFMLDAHLERLQASAAAIGLELPYGRQRIAAAIAELVARYPAEDGYLRLVVTRGAGSLGIDPRKCARPVMFIIADSLSVMDATRSEQGISLHIAETRRTPAVCLDPAVKSLNYLNNILARMEANRAGCDEALMLNLEGHVSEGSVDNIFIVKHGDLLTPPLADGMLAGITRAVVIELAGELGYPCHERSLSVDDLYAAEECFLTGTGAELIPVRRLGEHVFPAPPAPLTPVIMKAFKNRIARDCASG